MYLAKSHHNPETLDNFPVFRFQYKFNNESFMNLCNGVLYKHYWEPKTRFTSVPHVQQMDDDTVVVWRRSMDWHNSWAYGFERVTFNRATKKVETSFIMKNPNGTEHMVEKTIIDQDGNLDQYMYDVQGLRDAKLEHLKVSLEQIHRAMKFVKYDREEEQ